MEEITEIIDNNFRSGEGQNGRWTLMKIGTSSGKAATIFAPAAIGDGVSLEYNQQYKSWTAKKVDSAAQPAGKNQQLEQINQKLDRILGLLAEPIEARGDQIEINEDDIPF